MTATGVGQHPRPVVYGDADHVTVLVEWLTRVVGRQPAEVLDDPGVHGALQRLGNAVAEWCGTQGGTGEAQPPP